MKVINKIAWLGVLLLLALASQKCKTTPKEEPEKPEAQKPAVFTGKIVSSKNEALSDVIVMVNGNKIVTDKEGMFELTTDSAARYVFTVKKKGYALVSKIFRTPVKDRVINLKEAFVTTIDPSRPNVIRDLTSATSCTGGYLQNLNFDQAWKKIPLVYDSTGKLVDFGFPGNMQDVFNYMTSAPQCNPGATVSIPANAIVNSTGQNVNAPVTVAISTIDLESPDGMPGDYSYIDPDGQQGYMISMGAVFVELYSEKETFQLSEKARAQLSIPVDPFQMKFNKNLESKIPVLYYDEKDGFWKQEGEHVAVLNKKRNAYETEIAHFSVINFDYKISEKTCMRFRQEPIASPASSFNLTLISSAGYRTGTSTGDETSSCLFENGTNLHLATNIPKNEYLGVLLTQSGNLPYGIAVHLTGNVDYDPTIITNCPACSSGSVCFDPASSTCPEDCTTNNCSYVKIKEYPENLLAAAKVNTTTNQVVCKWIFKTSPTGSFNYTIRQIRNDATFVETTSGPHIYSPADPDPIKQAEVPYAGSDIIKITVTVNGVTSNEAQL